MSVVLDQRHTRVRDTSKEIDDKEGDDKEKIAENWLQEGIIFRNKRHWYHLKKKERNNIHDRINYYWQNTN